MTSLLSLTEIMVNKRNHLKIVSFSLVNYYELLQIAQIYQMRMSHQDGVGCQVRQLRHRFLRRKIRLAMSVD